MTLERGQIFRDEENELDPWEKAKDALHTDHTLGLTLSWMLALLPWLETNFFIVPVFSVNNEDCSIFYLLGLMSTLNKVVDWRGHDYYQMGNNTPKALLLMSISAIRDLPKVRSSFKQQSHRFQNKWLWSVVREWAMGDIITTTSGVSLCQHLPYYCAYSPAPCRHHGNPGASASQGAWPLAISPGSPLSPQLSA